MQSTAEYAWNPLPKRALKNGWEELERTQRDLKLDAVLLLEGAGEDHRNGGEDEEVRQINLSAEAELYNAFLRAPDLYDCDGSVAAAPEAGEQRTRALSRLRRQRGGWTQLPVRKRGDGGLVQIGCYMVCQSGGLPGVGAGFLELSYRSFVVCGPRGQYATPKGNRIAAFSRLPIQSLISTLKSHSPPNALRRGQDGSRNDNSRNTQAATGRAGAACRGEARRHAGPAGAHDAARPRAPARRCGGAGEAGRDAGRAAARAARPTDAATM